MALRKREKKTFSCVYLTTCVLLFALFFVTFLALNSAEDRCISHIDNIVEQIEADPCMSQCINSNNDYINNISLEMIYYESKDNNSKY